MRAMMSLAAVWVLLALAVFSFGACGGNDDDDSSGGGADDSADDSAADDSLDDEQDDATDDTSDDTGDDTTPDGVDDYLAPWPQSSIEPADYDESPDSGPLRQKAEAYDIWNPEHHQPYYGGLAHTRFSDITYTTPTGYGSWADSTIWSGTYLGGQTFRYHVTGDPVAKVNAIRIANALSGHLHVTGKPGFIARYRAPQDSLQYGGDEWCDDPANDRCHRVEEGEYAGDFWWGETSRDQYTGWFFGMALAFDLIDDEDMRDTIREDVALVLRELISTNWWITDEAGEPTDAGPNVLPAQQLSWLVIGYHITGAEDLKTELKKRLLNKERLQLQLGSIAFMNRYAQYYGNNLSHTNWYNLLRLGKVYFSADDYAFLLHMFETQVHTFTRLSHNAWYNGIFMGEGDYHPAARADDPYMEQLLEDMTDFPEPPNVEYYQPERTGYALDPFSVFMHDLQQQMPFLEEIFGEVQYQALEALPIPEQCSAGFKFQSNPFRIGECGSDTPTYVNSGTDYLVAYWLSAYYKHLAKDQ